MVLFNLFISASLWPLYYLKILALDWNSRSADSTLNINSSFVIGQKVTKVLLVLEEDFPDFPV